MLSDNGWEFYPQPDTHPYKLFLQREAIEHRTLKVRRPSPMVLPNGCTVAAQRTLPIQEPREVVRAAQGHAGQPGG